jgi:hypothetical protein
MWTRLRQEIADRKLSATQREPTLEQGVLGGLALGEAGWLALPVGQVKKAEGVFDPQRRRGGAGAACSSQQPAFPGHMT